MRQFSDVDDPQLPLHDPLQQRYELIRPLVLLQDRTASERAQETATHPETVGALKRRFEAQGMLGLLPDTLKVIPVGRRRRVPDEVVDELQRLKGLYDGFGYRELARILFHTCARRISHHSVHKLWHQLPPAAPQQLPLLDYHSHPERTQARQQVIELYCHGWSKRSISQFLHVSRPTINTWIARFEADNVASLEDKSRAPTSTVRKAWLPVMVEIYHLQKRHPDAGGFRIWSLRGKTDLSVRTIERIMAINRQVYKDIPGVGRQRHPPTVPQPHPFKATTAPTGCHQARRPRRGGHNGDGGDDGVVGPRCAARQSPQSPRQDAWGPRRCPAASGRPCERGAHRAGAGSGVPGAPGRAAG